MKPNTVVITLDRIKELEKYEQAVKERKSIRVNKRHIYFDINKFKELEDVLLVDDENIDVLAEIISALEKEKEELQIKLRLKHIEVSEFKYMSIFQFIKWKKTNNEN